VLLSILCSLLLLSSIVHVSAEPKVISLQTKQVSRSSTLQKRDADEVLIENFNTAYLINVTVGTPPQPEQLLLDTGSSDTWMMASEVKTTHPMPKLDELDYDIFCKCSICQSFKLYTVYRIQLTNSMSAVDTNKSSTLVRISDDFAISYLQQNSSVHGEYITDNLTLGDLKLSQVMMAVATDLNRESLDCGIMGMGLPASQARVRRNNDTKPYKSILEEMVSQGLIKSRAFSLWFNTLDSATGSIVFGGYDAAKFDGDLAFLSIQPPSEFYSVALTGIALTDDQGMQNLPVSEPLSAILDSGTTFMLLPTNIYNSLAYYFGATATDRGVFASCSGKDIEGNLTFQLGGAEEPRIYVPFSELFLTSKYTVKELYDMSDDDTPICIFAVRDSGSYGTARTVLGASFLRSAYVVHDVENMQIGIANALWNVTESNIVEISGAEGVKSATTLTGVTVTEDSATGVLAPGDVSTMTATASFGQPSSAMKSLTDGIKTTLNSSETRNPHLPTSLVSAASSTASATAASTTSASAASAPAVFEQPNVHVFLLALCGSIMLVAAMML